MEAIRRKEAPDYIKKLENKKINADFWNRKNKNKKQDNA